MADESPFDDFDMPADAPIEETEPQDTIIEDDDDPFGSAAPAPADDNEDIGFGFDQAEQPAADVDALPEPETKEDDVFGEAAVKAGVEEETPLSIWEKKHQEELAAKRQASRDAKDAAASDAKAEIKEFYAKREEALKRTMENNRMEEKNMREDLANLMENGTQWEKVAKLVNLNPKQDEKSTGRLRKLLIQLKNEKKESK